MTALTKPATGNQATVSGLGYTTLLKKIGGMDLKLATFDTSTLGITTSFKQLTKSDLADNPKVVIEHFWTGAAYTLGQTGTFTITAPAAGSIAGTAIVTGVKTPDLENGTPMMGQYEVTFDGYTGPALTPA